MVHEFDGTKHGKPRDMQAARRTKHLDLVRGGMNLAQAAHAVGVSKRTGKAWRNGRTRSTGRNERPLVDWYRGGMDKPKQIDARYLCMDERIAIADMRRAGSGVRAIARTLGRAPSTISRELRRNADDIGGAYGPHRAQQKATHRPRRPKPRKTMPGTRLWDETKAGPGKHWSPEQTGGRLRRGHPDNESTDACHETIHQAIYVQGKGELRLQLKHAMRRGHVARRHRGDGQSRRPRFREPMVMISDRPAEVADRAVPGHWEGDLICGAGNRSATGTLVERTTRFTILLHLPDGHDAEHVQDAIISKMRTLPALLRNSPAWDQGSELALHARVSAAPGMQVYFCDPRSPWQRGTNENTNGLPRQYFPQGDRPTRIHRGIPRRSRHGTRRQAPQDPGLHETQRDDPQTDRRHQPIPSTPIANKDVATPLEFAISPNLLGRRSCPRLKAAKSTWFFTTRTHR